MKRTAIKSFAILAVLSAVSAVSFSSTPAPDETLKELAGYRKWASIKGEPGQIKFLPASIQPANIPSVAL
jgi:hypothetical protein